MQTISKLLMMSAPDYLSANEREYEVDRVCKDIVKSFTSDEVAYVESFLASLSAHDLQVIRAGEGHEVADVYKKMGVTVEHQMIIEVLVNFAYQEIL